MTGPSHIKTVADLQGARDSGVIMREIDSLHDGQAGVKVVTAGPNGDLYAATYAVDDAYTDPTQVLRWVKVRQMEDPPQKPCRAHATSETEVQVRCVCGRWTLYAPFCSQCGRRVRDDVQDEG